MIRKTTLSSLVLLSTFTIGTRAVAISSLPCPNVGAQARSTAVLAAGQDNACENWVNPQVAQPSANLTSANLSSVLISGNLDGANLSLADLSSIATGCPGLNARNADFSPSNLTNARFVCSNFGGSDFSQATMSGMRCDLFNGGSGFVGANFTNATMTGFDCGWSTFDDAIFTGAALTGASFKESRFARTNFAGVDLHDSNFQGGDLSDANFASANLAGVDVYNYNSNRPTRLDRTDFHGAIMTGFSILWARDGQQTNFSGANLTAATLQTNFVGADFSGAILYQANLIGTCRGCDFSSSVLADADLDRAELYGADLTGAFLSNGTILAGAIYDAFTIFPSGTTFVGPAWGLPNGSSPVASGMVANFLRNDVSGLDFAGVQLPNANMVLLVAVATDFTGANLSSANLGSANLRGAILTGANLTGATLMGVTYDDATVFPSGQNYQHAPWGLPNAKAPWDLGMVPVPEPCMAMLLGAGAAGLAGLARRRDRVRSDGPEIESTHL